MAYVYLFIGVNIGMVMDAYGVAPAYIWTVGFATGLMCVLTASHRSKTS